MNKGRERSIITVLFRERFSVNGEEMFPVTKKWSKFVQSVEAGFRLQVLEIERALWA